MKDTYKSNMIQDQFAEMVTDEYYKVRLKGENGNANDWTGENQSFLFGKALFYLSLTFFLASVAFFWCILWFYVRF